MIVPPGVMARGIAEVPVRSGLAVKLPCCGAGADSLPAKNADASWLLINYLTSLENQKTVLNSGFALPTRLALKDDPFFSAHPASAAIFADRAIADAQRTAKTLSKGKR